MALYRAMRLRFGYGFESCDANGPRNVKNTNLAKHRAVFIFLAILPVGSKESVLKVPKRGQFHAAIRVTTKRCDSCPQGTLGIRTIFPPPTPKSAVFTFGTWFRKKSPYQGNLVSLTKGVKVLETAVGAVFASTRFSLVRISIRDLVADEKSLVRNSGVGGGGENLILRYRGEIFEMRNR